MKGSLRCFDFQKNLKIQKNHKNQKKKSKIEKKNEKNPKIEIFNFLIFFKFFDFFDFCRKSHHLRVPLKLKVRVRKWGVSQPTEGMNLTVGVVRL